MNNRKNISIVIGAGFGDEGKGKVVSHLASKSPEDTIVIRCNAGHQVGHTVVRGQLRHVFSSFGSGTLHGCPTYWSKNCTLYPTAFMNEYEILKSSGTEPKIFIHPLTPIVTPFDVMETQDYVNDYNKYRHNGTTGTGFGSTIQRQDDHYKLFFMDLFYEKIYLEKLKNIGETYYREFYYDDPDYRKDVGFNSYLKNIKKMISLKNVVMTDTIPYYRQFKPGIYDNVIFEIGQGILLDMDHGFFPNVTRSNTTCKNATFIPFQCNIDIYYVTRCYQTRHGNGCMSDETKLNLKNNENETNVRNDYQGTFRTGRFDLDLFKYALEVDSLYHGRFGHCNKHIVITCLDQLDKIPVIMNNGKVNFILTKDDFVRLIQSTFSDYNILLSQNPDSETLTQSYLPLYEN